MKKIFSKILLTLITLSCFGITFSFCNANINEVHAEEYILPPTVEYEPSSNPTETNYGTITITAEEGEIYYTIDGTDPNGSSNKYTGPIVVDHTNFEIKTVAIRESDGLESIIISKVFEERHNHNGWTPWTDKNSLPSTTGSYYLDVDVTLGGLDYKFSGDVKLCLNGHKVDLNRNKITTNENMSTLSIFDCNDTNEYYFKTDGDYWVLTDDKNQENVEVIKGGIITNGGTDGGECVNLGTMPHGYLSLNGGTFVGNIGYHGVINVGFGAFTMNGGCICGNYSSFQGGAIFIDEVGDATINGGVIRCNKAKSYGGAIYIGRSSYAVMYGGVIENNKSMYGGAIYAVDGGEFKLSNGEIKNNEASSDGGAIYLETNYYGGTFTLENGILSNNTTSGNGGAVYCTGNMTATGGSIKNCNGRSGGAIYATKSGVVKLNNLTIDSCKATSSGGAIYLSNATLEIASSTISKCAVETTYTGLYGGAIYICSYDSRDKNVFLVGKATKITDNKCNEKLCNICLYYNQCFNFLEGDNAPNSETLIGVTYYDYSQITVSKNITDALKDETMASTYAKYITSDNPDYEIITNSDCKIYLGKHEHDFTEIPYEDSTEEKPGHHRYYQCNNCKKYFTDPGGTEEITNIDTWLAEGGEGYVPVKEHYHDDLTFCPGLEPTKKAAGYLPYYQCRCGKYFASPYGGKEIQDLEYWKMTDGYIPPLKNNNSNSFTCFTHWILIILLLGFLTLNGILYFTSDFSANKYGLILSLIYIGITFVLMFVPHCGFCTFLIILNYVLSIASIIFFLVGGYYIERDDDSYDFKDIKEHLKKDLKKVKRGFIKTKNKVMSKIKKDYCNEKSQEKLAELNAELKDVDESISQGKCFKIAKNLPANTSKDISKKEIIDYITKTFNEEVEINERRNGVIKGFMPLADTYFTLVRKCEDGSTKPAHICFAYVYEFNNKNVCLSLKISIEDALELQKNHKNVYRTKFPNSKKPWFTIVVDETFKKEELFELINKAKENSKLPSPKDPLAASKAPFRSKNIILKIKKVFKKSSN